MAKEPSYCCLSFGSGIWIPLCCQGHIFLKLLKNLILWRPHQMWLKLLCELKSFSGGVTWGSRPLLYLKKRKVKIVQMQRLIQLTFCFLLCIWKGIFLCWNNNTLQSPLPSVFLHVIFVSWISRVLLFPNPCLFSQEPQALSVYL